MRIVECLTVFWLLGCAATVGAAAAAVEGKTENIQKQYCSFTRYPTLCIQTLMGLDSGNDPVHVISALVNKTIIENRLPSSYFGPKSTSQLAIQDAQPLHFLSDYCKMLVQMSVERLDKSLLALKTSPGKNKHDIQTWLSAALTFQQACKDSINNLNISAGAIMAHISQKMDYLSQLGSNPLALVNRISTVKSKNNTTARKLSEEEADFPNWVSAKDRKILVQVNPVKANAVVAKDGSGNYKTISAAINAASGNRFVIHVKAGVYKEKIRTNKDGITLIGDGKYSTIIVGDDSAAGGSSMPGSATFTITGDGFIARDIGFQNTAGPQGKQALALYVASDHSVFYRCSIAGHQDTLYALALRQFYRECDIYGTIDFIFGNAAAIFQNCQLIFRMPRHGDYNAILANGRSDPGQNTGFSVQNCKITVSSDLAPVKHKVNSYLGRPWKAYSRAIVMESNIDDAVSSRGWTEWPAAGKSTVKTLYFAEYANVGPAAATGNRVNWPGFHVIGSKEAVKFTVANFIAGTSWLPSTGVTFTSGL